MDNPPIFKWDLMYLKNPRGLVTSGFFNATIYTGAGVPLFLYTDAMGPNVTMTQLAKPALIEYVRTSEMNGQAINLTFNIKATNWLESGDILVLRLPRPVALTDSTECFGTSYWLDGPLTCNRSGDLQQADILISVTGRYSRML